MNNSHNLNVTKELLHDSNFYYIICVGNDGNYTYVNNNYKDRFNYISSDLIGQPYHITMHAEDTRICEEVGRLCFANPGKLFPATIRKHDGLGGYVYTQWEYVLMMEDDEPQGIFCLGYDITEYENVKSKVEGINRDLDNKNQLLSNIAYEQSHIVRAPLANIVGLVSILKTHTHDENVTRMIDMLGESSNQLDLVIKNIIRRTYS